MKRNHWWGLALLCLTSRVGADSLWPAVNGQLLPPIFRHFGVMPLGGGVAKKIWEGQSGQATIVVTPYDEVAKVEPDPTSTTRLFIDLGNWDYANRAALDARVDETAKTKIRIAGYVLNGDVGSMVTNPTELQAFLKKINTVRKDTPVFLACRYEKGTELDTCLPKTIRRLFHGVLWDVRLPFGFETSCFTAPLRCQNAVTEYFAGLQPGPLVRPPRGERILKWGVRLPLAGLASAADPVRLLKAFFAYFMNETRGMIFLLAMDGTTADKVAKRTAPYAQVGEFLSRVSAQQLQRNMDLASDLENPLSKEGKPIPVKKGQAVKGGGWETTLDKPYFANRFTVTFLPPDRPKALFIYAEDKDGTYFLKKYSLPALPSGGKPVTLFTQSIHFPHGRKFTFVPEGGKLSGASLFGFVTQ